MFDLNLNLWEALPWAVVALWGVYLTLLVQGLRRREIVRCSDEVILTHRPHVTFLVAARNEASCIEVCLRSLLTQDYGEFDVIAVNDRSTDETGAIMSRLETEFLGQLRVIHIEALPAGWLGKTHAMHVGSQAATGEWLCHIDADCELLSKSTLSFAVHEALKRRVDLLSLTPRFTLHSVWEQMTVPVCSSLMVIWFQPSRVNNPRLATSYANGAFLMMTRYSLNSVGGWCRFRGQISEDIAMARAVKSNGLPIAVLENDGLYQTRMYDSIRDSWNGWSRIFYGALPVKALTLSTIRLVLCSIIPTWGLVAWLCYAGLSSSSGGSCWTGAVLAAAVSVLLQQIYSAMIFRAVGGRFVWSLTAPLGHLVLLGMLGRALLNHVGLATTQWSGTVFRNGKPVIPAPPRVTALLSHATPVRQELDQPRAVS